MLKKFIFTGEVHRSVVDTITVAVFADNEDEAVDKARQTLDAFPKPNCVTGVNYCYIENREQIDSELLSLKGKDGVELT